MGICHVFNASRFRPDAHQHHAFPQQQPLKVIRHHRELPDDTSDDSKPVKHLKIISLTKSGNKPSQSSALSLPVTGLAQKDSTDSEGTISNESSPERLDAVHMGLTVPITDNVSDGIDKVKVPKAPVPDVVVIKTGIVAVDGPIKDDLLSVSLPIEQAKVVVVSEPGTVLKGPKLVVGASKHVMSILPCIEELTLVFRRDDVLTIVPFYLEDHLQGNRTLAKHIYNFALHMEGHNMVNLFTADPRAYHVTYFGENRRVVDKKDIECSFFTVRHVTYSSLTEGMWAREVNIQPLARTWPRQHAVLSQILQYNNVIISSYKSGIQFSTARKPSGAIRPWNVDVPLFRSVQPFRLTEYTKLPMDFKDLSPGKFVLLVFMVSGYKNKKGFNVTSLNVQFSIRLSNFSSYDEDEGEEPLPAYLCDETPLGVDKTTLMMAVDDELVFDRDIEVPGSEDGPLF
ncbi:uncharacterized protein EV420DRAFT_1645643 [Desarmillaria tabescens]|uniref:Uncharacterized protein n=1 Tax=Armillaria tabescens TaxID=1929756 RepID=A0AA39MZL9_ARMTA|nr:uncharacterized protein EV420DRAFT_1645643 [Desarmillaria tabescens]KAK0452791.1 hypothetical protein EV420DRAFT_1645643 [Desarmillaria tabescens]